MKHFLQKSVKSIVSRPDGHLPKPKKYKGLKTFCIILFKALLIPTTITKPKNIHTYIINVISVGKLSTQHLYRHRPPHDNLVDGLERILDAMGKKSCYQTQMMHVKLII